MAIMPGVDYRPINYSGVPKMRSGGPNVFIIHTIVGNDPAPAAHLSTRSDGHITQSRDTGYQSAASYQGNPRSIAAENDDTGSPFPNWDHNDGHQVPPFTPEQCESLARIAVWCFQTHGIPLVLAKDSKTNSAGIAYHRMGIDGNFAGAGYKYGGRVSGGEYWSTSTGKVCPGDPRIDQVINVIIPRARQLAGLDIVVAAGQQATRLLPSPIVDPDAPDVPNYIEIDGVAYQVLETQVPCPAIGGASGVTAGWASVFAGYAPLHLTVSHFRMANGDGTTSIRPYMPDDTVVPPQGYRPVGDNSIPKGATHIVFNHASAAGGFCRVESKS